MLIDVHPIKMVRINTWLSWDQASGILYNRKYIWANLFSNTQMYKIIKECVLSGTLTRTVILVLSNISVPGHYSSDTHFSNKPRLEDIW